MRFLALLRGINVGSDRKVRMAELRACFEAQGFQDVSTWANSGNVLFDADVEDTAELSATCESAIEETFGFGVPTTVLSAKDFASAMDRAPDGWGDPGGDSRHDAIFLIPPARPGDLFDAVGSLDEAEDSLAARGEVVFWSVPKSAYGQSPVAKVFNTGTYAGMTLRSSTTTKKLYELIARE